MSLVQAVSVLCNGDVERSAENLESDSHRREMGVVVKLPERREARRIPLSKRRLAAHYGRSIRWVEMRVAEGMPAHRDRQGRRYFFREETNEWLNQQGAPVVAGLATAQSGVEPTTSESVSAETAEEPKPPPDVPA